jgi:hypothetical protein
LSFFTTPNTALIEYITYHLLPHCFSIVLQSLLLPSGSPAITPHKRHYLILRERLQRIFTKLEILQEEGTLCGAQAWISQHISLSEDQEIIEHYTRAQFQQLHLDQDLVSSQNLDEVEDENNQDGYSLEVEVLDYQDYEELEVQ